jgi:cytochrome c-type biogenesis protein CcmF
MGKYWVTYEKDSSHPEKPLWFYHVRFESKSGKDNFVLTPNAFVNYKGNEGLMANPDARHYWDHDVFTYITSLPDPEKNKDTSSFVPQTLSVGDTMFYSNGFAVLKDLAHHKNIPGVGLSTDDSVTVASLKVFAKTGSEYNLEPVLINKDGQLFAEPDTANAESLVVRVQKVSGKKVELGLKESNSVMQYVTLKAYKFPFINILWLGTILMVIGFIISMMRRIETNRVRLKKI